MTQLPTDLNTPGVIWTCFLWKYNIEGVWNPTYGFYMGTKNHYLCVDLDTDWRFKAIEGKRTQAVMLGEYNGGFPVEFPLNLSDGRVFDKNGVDITKTW